MIARIQGVLDNIDRGSAFIRIGGDDGSPAGGGAPAGGGLTYEVLLPGYTAARLGGSIGKRVTLHTLHWVESTSQGAAMHPRLAGFGSMEDRRFFELFTTCKGIGNRKALRAMTLPTAQIAAAIADRDVALLKSLPEIGARTAETIVATLHGKVDAFLAADASAVGEAGEPGAPRTPAPGSVAREAIETLVKLGENRTQVVAWVDRALREAGESPTADQIVARAYAIKSGG